VKKIKIIIKKSLDVKKFVKENYKRILLKKNSQMDDDVIVHVKIFQEEMFFLKENREYLGILMNILLFGMEVSKLVICSTYMH
jgi:hypothetical protein